MYVYGDVLHVSAFASPEPVSAVDAGTAAEAVALAWRLLGSVEKAAEQAWSDEQTLQLSPAHPLVQPDPHPPFPAVDASAGRCAGGSRELPHASVEQPVLVASPGGHWHTPPLDAA